MSSMRFGFRLLFLVLLFSGRLVLAQTPDSTAAPAAPLAATPDTSRAAAIRPAPTPRPILRDTTWLSYARQLVVQRRYESAYRLLDSLDVTNSIPEVVLPKVNLVLNYYVLSDNMEVFGLANLAYGQYLDSLRMHPGYYTAHRFPVGAVLDTLLRRDSTDYRLHRALADYYFALADCACADDIDNDEAMFRKAVEYYRQAHNHGLADARSYYALAFAQQRLGHFAESEIPYTCALELRPQNPTTHLNLAFVYLELRRLDQARYHAIQASLLFPDEAHKLDADFLLSEIEARQEEAAKAAAAAKQAAAKAAASTKRKPVSKGRR